MKVLFPFLLFSIVLFCSCKDDDAGVNPIFCSGIVTDTSGTNDTARIYMPTAFTPDGNGLNDIIRPIIKSAASMNYTLYDDGGTQVFTTATPNAGFSLATAPSTYTKYHYKVQITTLEGHQVGECGIVYALSCIPSNPEVALHYEDEITWTGFSGHTMEQISNCP